MLQYSVLTITICEQWCEDVTLLIINVRNLDDSHWAYKTNALSTWLRHVLLIEIFFRCASWYRNELCVWNAIPASTLSRMGEYWYDQLHTHWQKCQWIHDGHVDQLCHIWVSNTGVRIIGKGYFYNFLVVFHTINSLWILLKNCFSFLLLTDIFLFFLLADIFLHSCSRFCWLCPNRRNGGRMFISSVFLYTELLNFHCGWLNIRFF